FYESMDKLNIIRPDVICRATEHIAEQIQLIQKLINKGFAYDTPEAVYFEADKFDRYGELFGQKLADKKTARSDVVKGKYQRSPYDFVLWVKRIGIHKDHIMHWDSPWGDGFPGWHIECSAMSMKYLGEQFDIHTGGEDHLSVHHPNEIAQSEAATGKSPFVKYWVHHAFLMVDGQKMSKSLGNLFTIDDVVNKGFEPLALRYLYLTAHYRDPLNFTWESLSSAQNALSNLRSQVFAASSQNQRTVLSFEKDAKREDFARRFRDAINDDLAIPKALAVLWAVLKSNIPSEDKYDLTCEFDQVLGLGLSEIRAGIREEIPDEILELLEQRDKLRKSGNFSEADKIRQEIERKGYIVNDAKEGSLVRKK
ncbi:MAG: cysteine--tRNA ligase, partial [Patescibacteria group bacterium]|nr:cysteine--tRNA ligase [Patescibacteria group bacterium]